ncbi:MAG: EAL domain-containing protein, partial [Burkholderiales bacterium]
RDGIITLRRPDGTVLARSPDFEEFSQRPLPPGHDYVADTREIGSHISVGSTDGVERLFSFRRLKDYSLIAVVAQSIDTVLADYYQQRRTYLAGGAFVSVVLFLLMLVVIAQLKREERAGRELRASEARFRSLSRLSSDTYWEQDDQYRFTSFTGSGSERVNVGRGIPLGTKRWELHTINMTAAAWAAHIALLDARKEFHDLELCRLNEAGEKVWVSSSGEPVFDEAGIFRGYRGVGKDITERKRAEQLRALEHAVARCLADADSIPAALQAVMHAICETENWSCGRYFGVDEEAGVLRFIEAWGIQSPVIEQFIEKSRDLVFRPGVGLSGRVWQSGQPLWVADVGKDPRVLWTSSEHGDAFRGAFVFPATVEGRTIGALAFSCREIREPDIGLLEAIGPIGSQIGQFLQRKQAEEVLHESEARFRSLTELSSDWYWEQDRDLRFTLVVGSGPSGSERAIGKRRWELSEINSGGIDWTAHKALTEAHQPFRDFEYLAVTPEGKRRYYSISGQPLFDGAGAFIGYRGTGKDVTERRGNEEELRRFRAAMDVSADLILLIDPVGMHYVDVNDAACRSLGYSREEMLAMGPGEIFSVTREELAELYKRLIAGDLSETAVEGWYRCKDGSMLPVESFRRAVRSAEGYIIVAVARDISERIASEEALRKSDERFNIVARATNDVIWDHDLISNQRWWNDSIETMLGYDRSKLLPSAESWYQGIHPRDMSRVISAFRTLLASTATNWQEEYRFARGDGSYAYVLDRGFVIRDEEGKAVRAIGAMTDITAREKAEQQIRNRELQQSVIAAFGQSALANTDLDELIAHAITAVAETLDTEFCSFLQLTPDGTSLVLRAGTGWAGDWMGRQIIDVNSRSAMTAVIATREPIVVEDYEEDKRFTRSQLALTHGIRSSVAVVVPKADGVFGALGIQSRQPGKFSTEQVSFLQSIANTLAAAVDRKHTEEQLTRLAQFDTTTGLPNRVLFHDRLEQSLVQGKRNDWLVGVMFIDLDRFKVVNDTLGHNFGDKLLVEVGARLVQSVRGGDTVGRLSGDEFAVVLSDLARADDAGLVAQKVLEGFSAPFDLDGHKAYVTASIGIAVSPGDGLDPDVLLKNADTAMYRVKSKGRNAYQFYMPEMNERAVERLELETDLRGALERGEFFLHYQPKVELRSHSVIGFEALLRWKNRNKGLVPPAEFIPLLEETGLINPVGEWALREVCRQIKAWQRSVVKALPVAVNLSARQFQQKDLDVKIRQILAENGVDPALLEIEITESFLMHDAELAARTLQALQDSGVRVSVDDFGTGYSSLSYLRRFRLDALKIDRSFVDNVVANGDDAAITLAIINIAHSLKLNVVAEGVETEAQLNFLSANGCDAAQGYLFSKPVGAEECERMLREGRRLKLVPKDPRDGFVAAG